MPRGPLFAHIALIWQTTLRDRSKRTLGEEAELQGSGTIISSATIFCLMTFCFVDIQLSSPFLLYAELPETSVVSLEAAAWNILYSPCMPAHPTPIEQGWDFDFPSCDGANACSVRYVTTAVNSLAKANSVQGVFQITTTGNPQFHYKLRPDNTCDHPAHVRYILQRRGDDLVSEFSRWFSVPGFRLERGSTDLRVSLKPDQWISVFGKRADTSESSRRKFYEALQDLGNVGFVFGGGCFLSHGVNVVSGSARFLVTRYSIK